MVVIAKLSRGEVEPIEIETTQNSSRANNTQWGDFETKIAKWEIVASQLEGVMESLHSITDAHTFLVGVVEDSRDGPKASIGIVNDSVKETMNTFQDRLEELNLKMDTLTKAMSGNSIYACEVERTKISKLKAFGGVRDAKDVDNFLFDMESFFNVTKRDSVEDRLKIIPL